MATVWIPPLMRSLTHNLEQVEVEGETVRQIIAALDARYPGIAARLIDDNRIRPGISVAVDGVIGNKGLREAVKPNSEVHFVPAMSGG
jgi:molybdopterin synthase sulfur carrier subunit